jgi:hypothetical protein
MLSDLDVANYLVHLYDPPKEPLSAAGFDFAGYGLSPQTSHIFHALKRQDGITWIFLRGSKDWMDWRLDFTAWVSPFAHGALGPVHPGFYAGVQELWHEIQDRTEGPWALGGHSLGAGRCDIMGGLMILDGHPPLRTVLFGEPLPGFQTLADIWKGRDRISYRNGDHVHHDPVTDWPADFPPERYTHPTPLTLVSGMPKESHNLLAGVFAWHFLTNYRRAIVPPS